MIIRHRDKRKEWAKNIFLILLAIGVVVIFFNLDLMQGGDSVFSRSADRKIKFTGDLDRQDYTERETDRLLKYVKRNNKIIDKMIVEVSPQDKYKKISGSTQMLFEVHLLMTDGTKISTPTRRTTRGNLMSAILTKISKDMKAYKRLKDKGTKVKSLVNTM